MSYDLKKLNELSGGDEEFKTTIIETFLQETPVDFANLQTAIEGHNFDLIYKHAHKIKPNVDLLGMNEVKGYFIDVENHARGDKDMDAIKMLVDKIEALLESAFEEFKSYLVK